MPTIISHAVVPLALGLGLGRREIPLRLMAAGVLASILPDFDVLGFRFGIAYTEAFGHRGASHSLFAAAVVGLVGAHASHWLGARATSVFLFIFVAAASHGLLDALTNGGHGVALFWPWSEERYFSPIRPIVVSPLGLSRFLSDGVQSVIASEVAWVWLPCCVLALVIRSLSCSRYGSTNKRKTERQ